MKTTTVLSTIAALALSVNVQANQDFSGFYIGGGVGTTAANLSADSVSYSPSTDGSALKVIGGYQFNRIVAIEAQYTKYGDVYTAFATAYNWAPTTISLAANLGYTFDNGIRPFATIGFSSLDLDESQNFLNDSNSTALRIGAGLEYTPASLSGVSFRAGYEADAFIIDTGYYAVDDINVFIGSLYVAATYKF